MHEARLTTDEYCAIRKAIREHGLWWNPGEKPPRIEPALIAGGWEITYASDCPVIVAIGMKCCGRKILQIAPGLPSGVEITAKAHTLAHDILGHEYETDVIMPGALARMVGHRGAHPADDLAAQVASTLIMIPDAFAHSGMTAEMIARWTYVPTRMVMRRLSGLVLVDGEPETIIRLDRRGPGRAFSGQPTPLRRRVLPTS